MSKIKILYPQEHSTSYGYIRKFRFFVWLYTVASEFSGSSGM